MVRDGLGAAGCYRDGTVPGYDAATDPGPGLPRLELGPVRRSPARGAASLGRQPPVPLRGRHGADRELLPSAAAADGAGAAGSRGELAGL